MQHHYPNVPSHALARRSGSEFVRLLIAYDALLSHMRWVAGPGTGKTTGITYAVIWDHLLKGWPVIAIDPTGAISSTLISIMIRLIQKYPPHLRHIVLQRCLNRLVYVDLAATDEVVPLPFYEQQSQEESLFTTASRILHVMSLSDPALHTASQEGFNALYEIGLYAGMLITALGQGRFQLPEVVDLIRNPKRWAHLFPQAVDRYPELRQATAYFKEFMSITNPALRSRRSRSFLNKLAPLLADPTLLAAFGTGTGGIDFDTVVKNRQCLIYDLGGVTDPAIRQLKMLWIFRQVYEMLQQRGVAGRRRPVLFVIDEISNLQGHNTENPVLAQDINDLCAVWARNVGCKLCIAHQNLGQLDKRIQISLSQFGTQVIGTVPIFEDALTLAYQIYCLQPLKIKKTEPVYMATETWSEGESWGDPFGTWQQQQSHTRSTPKIVFEKTIEYTPEEQYVMVANLIQTLPKFTFLVKGARREGDSASQVRLLGLERVMPRRYADEALISQVRAELRKKWGQPLKTLLSDITDRLNTPITASVILPDNAQERDLSTTEEDDDESWRDELEE